MVEVKIKHKPCPNLLLVSCLTSAKQTNINVYNMCIMKDF